MSGDRRRFSPAAERNASAILDVLRLHISQEAHRILEIASGSGQHAAAFAPHFPEAEWIPSDTDPESIESIRAWASESEISTLREPVDLNVQDSAWRNGMHPVLQSGQVDALICINMLHVSPWDAAEGLFEGAAKNLAGSGVIYLYGPFNRGGRYTSSGNEVFDKSLRHQNADWGLRDLEDVENLGRRYGFELTGIIDMPANNLSLLFRSAGEIPKGINHF